MAEPTSTHAFSGVPTGPFSEHDIEQLHFAQAIRGYRMDQVDEVIDALSARLRELETRERDHQHEAEATADDDQPSPAPGQT